MSVCATHSRHSRHSRRNEQAMFRSALGERLNEANGTAAQGNRQKTEQTSTKNIDRTRERGRERGRAMGGGQKTIAARTNGSGVHNAITTNARDGWRSPATDRAQERNSNSNSNNNKRMQMDMRNEGDCAGCTPRGGERPEEQREGEWEEGE